MSMWISTDERLPEVGDAQPEMDNQVFVYWDGHGGPAWGFAHWDKVPHLSKARADSYRRVTHWAKITKP
jgi:hypothetical protein